MTNIISLEKGTCTDRAIGWFLDRDRERREADNVNPFFETEPNVVYEPTFKAVISRAKDNPGDIFFIPLLKTEVNAVLSCSQGWRDLSEMVFRLPNPPLYLAGRDGETGSTCATLPNLRGLIRKSLQLTFVDAQNTQDAARMVQAGEADLCITNEHAVQVHSLQIREQLKEMIMFWFPWVYEEGYGGL